MHPYIIQLKKALSAHANPQRAIGASAYMRNQFVYFGMEAKLWRSITKDHFKKYGVPAKKELPVITKELWSLPEREYQYFAVEMITAAKKQWDEKVITLIEYCITHKSWWDSVDQAASLLTGAYFKLFPHRKHEVTDKWNRSNNCWLQRSSLLFQKAYKKDTDTEMLARYIIHLAGSKEFFVQKAIGWALREYSKTDPRWVVKFVKTNKLASLSEREAMKRIKNLPGVKQGKN